jgi:hypothetical protein
MPVIVVGADTPLGEAVVSGFDPLGREVRVFVTDPIVGERLKERGCKVAIGDVSDGSHVGGAAHRAFTAVLVSDALLDDRERAFADTPEATVAEWVIGLKDAGVQRVIWVNRGGLAEAVDALREAFDQLAIVDADEHDVPQLVAAVKDLDEAERLPIDTQAG